jgi:cell division septum initiation protein DivIVA
MVVSTIDPQALLESLGEKKVVLMPLDEYQALMRKIEELEDIRDMLQAEVEYRSGEGRSFREFLAENEDAFDPLQTSEVSETSEVLKDTYSDIEELF